jgi:hypothetical protein
MTDEKRVHSLLIEHGAGDDFQPNRQRLTLSVQCPVLASIIIQDRDTELREAESAGPGHSYTRTTKDGGGVVIQCECGLLLGAHRRRIGALHVPVPINKPAIRVDAYATIAYELAGPPPSKKNKTTL